MKLLFLLTVVLELSLNSPPRATRRRRVPPSSRQVRRRLRRLRARQLLVALFAASTLQWITRKPRNHHSQYPGRGAYSARLGRPVRPPTLPTPARPPAFQTARPNGGRARAFLRRAREIFTARCTSSAFKSAHQRTAGARRPLSRGGAGRKRQAAGPQQGVRGAGPGGAARRGAPPALGRGERLARCYGPNALLSLTARAACPPGPGRHLAATCPLLTCSHCVRGGAKAQLEVGRK